MNVPMQQQHALLVVVDVLGGRRITVLDEIKNNGGQTATYNTTASLGSTNALLVGLKCHRCQPALVVIFGGAGEFLFMDAAGMGGKNIYSKRPAGGDSTTTAAPVRSQQQQQ